MRNKWHKQLEIVERHQWLHFKVCTPPTGPAIIFHTHPPPPARRYCSTLAAASPRRPPQTEPRVDERASVCLCVCVWRPAVCVFVCVWVCVCQCSLWFFACLSKSNSRELEPFPASKQVSARQAKPKSRPTPRCEGSTCHTLMSGGARHLSPIARVAHPNGGGFRLQHGSFAHLRPSLCLLKVLFWWYDSFVAPA